MTNLKNVKVGDIVLVDNPRRGKSLAIVKKITPSGLLKIGNMLFYPSGEERTSDKWRWCMAYSLTETELAEFRQKCFISRVKKAMREYAGDLSYEEAKTIEEIINKENRK